MVREFFVCVDYIGDIKTAIVTDKDRVIGVIGDEGMSNTDLLRAYSHLIREHSQDGAIYTNHKQIKYRRLHTGDFDFRYIYRDFSGSRKKQFRELAYRYIDEQDKLLKRGN